MLAFLKRLLDRVLSDRPDADVLVTIRRASVELVDATRRIRTLHNDLQAWTSWARALTGWTGDGAALRFRIEHLHGRESQQSITRWATETFGDCTVERAAARTAEEMVEFLAVLRARGMDMENLAVPVEWLGPADREQLMKELADVVVCGYRLAQLCGFELHAEVDRVMQINHARQWVRDGKGCGYHVKQRTVVMETNGGGTFTPRTETNAAVQSVSVVNKTITSAQLLTCLQTAIATDLLPTLVKDELSPDPDLEMRAHLKPYGAVHVVEMAAKLLRTYQTVRREDRAALSQCTRTIDALMSALPGVACRADQDLDSER